jgi:glutathione S-transferase
MEGLRLVVTAVPGPPWSESAKAVFHVKRIPYVPVAQQPGVTNEALRAWTGHDNAPIAVYGRERPRTGWAEILFLAERLAPEPPLIPTDPEERALLFGLAHEICGEDGLGWNRRHLMIRDALAGRPGIPRAVAEYLAPRYDYNEEAARRAPGRIAEILRLLAAQFRRQRHQGRNVLLGDRLSALDLYWACFAALLRPLPEPDCPMPDWLRESYTAKDPEILDALDPALLEHRDRIYRQFLPLPVDS